MENIEIKNRYTGEIIISGKYEGVKDAVEKNINADFRNADFRNANFRNANFQDADFRNADFRNADFRNADFRNADFRNANFRNAKGLGNITKQIAYIFHQYPTKGNYTFYKKVVKISKGEYVSCYDSDFKYFDGKIAKVQDVDEDVSVSCGKGLHVSHPFYWQKGDCLIAVEVPVKVKCDGKMIDNIITCLDGKLRVRQIKVIEEVKDLL